MSERYPNHKVGGPLGIRTGLWFIACGVLLASGLVITISRHQASSVPIEAAAVHLNPAQRDPSHQRSSARPISRVPSARPVSDSDPQITSPDASGAISNELRLATGKLKALRVAYSDQHPSVKEQIWAVASLELSAAAGEPPDLAQAKARFARLRVHFSDEHPDVQSQLKEVIELQR